MSSCSNFSDSLASAQAGSGYIQCLLIIAAGLVLFSSSGICGSFSGIQAPYVKKSCTSALVTQALISQPPLVLCPVGRPKLTKGFSALSSRVAVPYIHCRMLSPCALNQPV